MIDLSVEFAGLQLRNPLVVASGPVARDLRQVKKAEACGAAAVIFKAVLPPGQVYQGADLRCYIDRKSGGLFGLAGGRLLTYEEGIDLVKVSKKESTVKIGVNVPFFKFEERELYASVAKGLAAAGADFVEVNFSPQIPSHFGISASADARKNTLEKALKTAGDYVRELPMWASEGIKVIKQAVKVPVIGKIEPEGLEAVTMAVAMENGGADGIDAINAPNGAFLIDIFDGGKLMMPAAHSSLFMFSGAPLKPVAQAIVARTAKAVKIPIMGTGGLMNWKDVVEMIMFGATAVSFHTLLMIHGFEALTKIEKGLREYMEKQGYRTIHDFRGLALPQVAATRVACQTLDMVASIAPEKCIGCDICTQLAHCLAISKGEDNKAVVAEKECLGCGVCSLFCPTKAITMVEVHPGGGCSTLP